MISIGKVVHGLELLIDDSDASLVGSACNLLDIFGSLAHVLQNLVDFLRALNRGLRVELSWIRYLEEDILHDIAAIFSLELELLALEQDIVETPDWGRKNGRDT